MVEGSPNRVQEDYGDWMIVARRKPMNKARGKLNNTILSQLDESV